MIDKRLYENAKKRVESDLRNYPYWLIAAETPNLGYPTKWGTAMEKSTLPWENNSYVEKSVLDDMEKKWKVHIITKVLNILDANSKKIVEEWYFRDTTVREEIQDELNLDKNKFYYYRNRALKKFMIALGYI